MRKTVLMLCLTALAASASAALRLPVVVADSESFEIVGRIADGALVLHVDRAPDNSPVLGARLSVETGGRSVDARFEPEEGVYRVADADWLRPLAAPGTYPLAFTLLAGDDGDLLAGDLLVEAEAAADAGSTLPGWGWALSGLVLAGAGGLIWRRTRRNAR